MVDDSTSTPAGMFAPSLHEFSTVGEVLSSLQSYPDKTQVNSPIEPTRRHFVVTGITQQSTTGNTALAAIKSSYTDLNLWRALE
ncbi:hypothetical protein RRG08_056534 [Elysia crispata]|uniref:Uncharacterized protein n=1 Tax=Elysia crispata TaxID=231223 RepID=A0AAE0ZKT2_9GAST|nr:hypothetical protein RRG08_056534 [Elysia crispata]